MKRTSLWAINERIAGRARAVKARARIVAGGGLLEPG